MCVCDCVSVTVCCVYLDVYVLPLHVITIITTTLTVVLYLKSMHSSIQPILK